MSYQWFTTMPNPRVVSHSADAGQRGWRLHLVEMDAAFDTTRLGHKINRTPALCGLRPGHGWGIDLFIDAECERCTRRAEKIGIDLPDSPG